MRSKLTEAEASFACCLSRRPFKSAGFAANVHGANNQIDNVRDACMKKEEAGGGENEEGQEGSPEEVT